MSEIAKTNQRAGIPSAAYPFTDKYVTIQGYKIHYVEEGQGEPILFIHGNPTWSYLWRNILPTAAIETKKRGIALDLLGFGKSDKPDVDYTVNLHYKIVEGFIEYLGLKNIFLVLHDWGGALGLGYAVRHPKNIKGIAMFETFVGPWSWQEFGKYKIPFKIFRSPFGYILFQVFNMFVNKLMPSFVLKKENLSEEIMRNYRMPFPTIQSRKAIRAFPKLIPIEGKPKESFVFVKNTEDKLPKLNFPSLIIKPTPGGAVDTEEKIQRFRKAFPMLAEKDFGPGVHYLQEDNPEKLSRLLVEWIREQRL